MKSLAANRKKNYAKKTGGGPPPQDFTPAEELALSSNEGRPMMEGVEGGISSDPGGSRSDSQAYVQGMFQVIYVTMSIQQLFVNIVGSKRLDIEHKRFLMKKTRLEIEKLQYEKKVVHD